MKNSQMSKIMISDAVKLQRKKLHFDHTEKSHIHTEKSAVKDESHY